MINPHLRIALHRSTTTGMYAEIASARPVHAARILEGRTAEQALAIVPTLFSLCGRAHYAAASGAIDALRGIERRACELQARRQSALAETIREHLLRIHMDWPRLIGEPLNVNTLSLIQRLCRAAANSGTDGGTLRNLLEFIEDESLMVPATVFLQIDTPAELRQWASKRESVSARMLAWVARFDWPSISDMPEPIPDIALDTLAQRLRNDDAPEFIARPTWGGSCKETGPFARQASRPLIRALIDGGEGALLARFAARLVEVAQLGLELAGIYEPDGWGNAVDGLAVVEASRGRLAHLVEMDAQERISRYRILAPTEWNFHPRGVASCLLAAIDPQDDMQLIAQRANLAVHAIDPCVGYTLCWPDSSENGTQCA